MSVVFADSAPPRSVVGSVATRAVDTGSKSGGAATAGTDTSSAQLSGAAAHAGHAAKPNCTGTNLCINRTDAACFGRSTRSLSAAQSVGANDKR
ncbi:MAG: hypothetical protein MI757_05750 [Pirellulales bacterium]|nr:hypothetical protein [Pirellulales bacterium]